VSDQVRGQDVPERPASRFTPDDVEDQPERARPATRITLRPHDPSTGEEVEKVDVVRGYECGTIMASRVSLRSPARSASSVNGRA
jgi:hypothetical protein